MGKTNERNYLNYKGGEKNMCLNCGCGMPDEKHDNPDNIVMDDIKKAAESNSQTVETAINNMKSSLDKAATGNP